MPDVRSSPGLKTYSFPEKNTWREDQWDYIRDHVVLSSVDNGYAFDPQVLPESVGDACGLALMGPEALDIDVAGSCGFNCWNIIAVESHEKSAKAIASKALCPVVKRPLSEVMKLWPLDFDKRADGLKLSFVVADFCSPITSECAVDLVKAIPPRGPIVVCANFLAGRESPSSRLYPAYKILKKRAESYEGYGTHRGEQFVRSARRVYKKSYRDNRPDRGIRDIVYRSYVSSAGQRMDSVFFTYISMKLSSSSYFSSLRDIPCFNNPGLPLLMKEFPAIKARRTSIKNRIYAREPDDGLL